MYGFNVIYAVKAKAEERAKSRAKRKVQEDVPSGMDYVMLGASCVGLDTDGIHLSTEVRVAFPDHDTEYKLPDRSTLFPSAESVGYLAVKEEED